MPEFLAFVGSVVFLLWSCLMFGIGRGSAKPPAYEWPTIKYTLDKTQRIIEIELSTSKKTRNEWFIKLDPIIGQLRLNDVSEKVVMRSSIWHVLGIMPTTDKTKINNAYRKMSMVYHPDHGGSNQAFNTLSDARDKALEKCK